MKSTEDILNSYGKFVPNGSGLFYARLVNSTGGIFMRVGDTKKTAASNLLGLVWLRMSIECDVVK